MNCQGKLIYKEWKFNDTWLNFNNNGKLLHKHFAYHNYCKSRWLSIIPQLVSVSVKYRLIDNILDWRNYTMVKLFLLWIRHLHLSFMVFMNGKYCIVKSQDSGRDVNLWTSIYFRLLPYFWNHCVSNICPLISRYPR